MEMFDCALFRFLFCVTGSSCFDCAGRQAGRYGGRMNYATPDMPLGKALYIRKTPFRRLGKKRRQAPVVYEMSRMIFYSFIPCHNIPVNRLKPTMSWSDERICVCGAADAVQNISESRRRAGWHVHSLTAKKNHTQGGLLWLSHTNSVMSARERGQVPPLPVDRHDGRTY